METELIEKQKIFSGIALEVADLLLKKNTGYGDNFVKLGIEGIALRIGDKEVRIGKLSKGKDDSYGSILDAFYDIAGYAILGIITTQPEKYPIFDWNPDLSSYIRHNCLSCGSQL